MAQTTYRVFAAIGDREYRVDIRTTPGEHAEARAAKRGLDAIYAEFKRRDPEFAAQQPAICLLRTEDRTTRFTIPNKVFVYPTEAEMQEERRNTIQYRLEGWIRSYNESRLAFIKYLTDAGDNGSATAHTLQWRTQSMMREAEAVQIAAMVLEEAKTHGLEAAVEENRKQFMRRILAGNFVNQSTNPLANLREGLELEAMAAFIRLVDDID